MQFLHRWYGHLSTNVDTMSIYRLTHSQGQEIVTKLNKKYKNVQFQRSLSKNCKEKYIQLIANIEIIDVQQAFFQFAITARISEFTCILRKLFMQE